MRKVYVTIFFVMIAGSVSATHLRSAYLKIEPLCDGTLSYRITVTVYMNTLSRTQFGGYVPEDGYINFGDGIIHIIPPTPSVVRPDLGVNIAVASYSVVHTYSGSGFYQVTYVERDRSAGIPNIPNSGDVPYVTWASFQVSPATACNTFPILTIPPVDRACSYNTFFHSPGAYDAEGDSLSYELGVPFRDEFNPVFNYVSPASPGFYTDYSHGNEAGNGPPSFNINPVSGLITWDAPGLAGEYNIAFRIREWKKDPATGTYTLMSITTRDMQIIVAACVNKRPDLSAVPKDTCVVAGAVLDFSVQGVDPEQRDVKIEVFSEVVDWPAEKKPASYTPDPPLFSASPAQTNFHWETDCIHARQQPYQVVFKVTDNPPHDTQLTAFKTWNVKVMAPAPVWKTQTLDLSRRYATLEWEPYTCDNAQFVQVWRKVGMYPYTPGKCDTGIPKFLGYDLVGEVDPSETSFTDTNFGNGLSVGAQYCYRLVAFFDANTSSMISPDYCFDPIETDAPVPTHVTVEKTSAEEGSIRISWRSPFAINKVQFPEPYEYELYRATGFADDTGLTKISQRVEDDTTFLDQMLNTEDSVYNYRIVVYAKPQGGDAFVPVDTSARASSVWLNATPALNQIELNWRDSVPWSNVAFHDPWHLIYRGVHGEPLDDMVLLDSVNISEDGFRYVDAGLAHNVFYTYRILARGSYGNPKIALQENFSQVASQYPESDLLPCPAIVTIADVDCKTFRMTTPCEQDTFSNTIQWSLASGFCRRDIAYFKVYAATDSTAEFELLADRVYDPFYIDNNLSSVARCYKISAIDTRGVEGPLSSQVCNENCTFFALPNMFTPNKDGCNDVFSAYYYPREVMDSHCEEFDPFMCPRFVKHVSFQVFNRWGRPVYSYSSGDGKPVTINWNGKDDKGNDLDNGIYFYQAQVKFEANDPDLKKEKFKGWIHLMR